MKLKRMWPGLCILIVFMIFDVIMVASSSFFSGLFPSNDMTLAYSIILTVLSVLIMNVLTFLFGRICDHIGIYDMAETKGIRVIYALMLIAVFAGGIFYRLDVLSRTTVAPTGKLSLFENAKVGATSVSTEYDLLSVVYSDILRVVLYFTGNKIITAFGVQIAFFMVFVILGTITCRMLLGKAASVIFAAYVSFMPIFAENLQKAIIGTDELFMVMLGIELLIISMYLKDASDGAYTSKWFIFWYVIVGVVVGFMAYLDAGTLVSVLPLLLSVMFMAGDDKHTGAFSFIFVVLAGAITFFAMIIQEAGLFKMGAVLANWASYYFHNLNTFSTFWTYTNYKLVYVITFVAMSGVLVGFFRNKNFGRVSPWLLSTILVFMATPFFGATRMNDQNMVTVFFAFVLACVVSLITLTRHETVHKDLPEKTKTNEQLSAEAMVTGTTVAEKEKETEKESEDEKPRFVPEGMVLPTGAEDEMDIDKSKMRMPKFEGKISLDRKQTEKKEEPEKPDVSEQPLEEKNERKVVFKKKSDYKTAHVHVEKEKEKDEFDLPFKSGDDFDI
ncbi:hypothetical protein [Butyrivibrio sp. VCB2006]|uniref:hypothetical protein n=1 Tax=Butyrivibrio sp. VCB2006 TaxID=1280679 RepID=UPI000492751C|nr:hypothetical protein [Butyrivibrio sp. VCB2006]